MRERLRGLDGTTAGVLCLLGLVLTSGAVGEPVRADALGVLTLVPLAAPLLWRRAAPVAALGALLVVVAVLDALLGPDVPRCLLVPPAVLLLVFSAGVRLARGPALTGLALGVAVLLAEALTTYGGLAVVLVPLAALVWSVARVARGRALAAGELERRTAELRRLRDERARRAVAAEREQVASRLDELLGRRLGELSHLAADGERASDAATATRLLREIETQSRRTLQDMRAAVGVLRDDDPALPARPQPTLEHLEAMLAQARGATARLTVVGDPHVLPPGVELSAFRIVEHLLAALEEAPEVDVRIAFLPDALELAVSGSARGHARDPLDRARERVALHDGTLRTVRRGRRAEVVAALPLLARA